MKTIGILTPLAFAVLASGYTLYSDTTSVNLTASLASFAPKGLYIGAAISPQSDSDAQTDGALLTRKDYNMFVSENDCKWAATEPSQGQFSYAACDAALKFAQSVGGVFRAHNLNWGSYNPGWLTSGNFNSSQLSSILTNHIKNVAGYYAGKVYGWDVVNEAIADDGSSTPHFKNSDWYPTLPNFVDVAFQAARAADPKAKLFYNDYSAEACGQAKSDAVYAMVKDLQSRGIPIDGVGLQMHINTNATSYITRATVGCNIKRLGALGLEVHITEMDVRCRAGNGDTCDQRLKAYVYQTVLLACLDNPTVCKGLLTWGYTDKYTWLDGFQNPDNVDPQPLLNDINGKQVVAWNEFQAVLKVGTGSVPTSTSTTTTAAPTTTTTKTTTSKTTTTTSATTTGSSSCAAQWAQCGGIGWAGATCCTAPYTCQVGNPYYSQCL